MTLYQLKYVKIKMIIMNKTLDIFYNYIIKEAQTGTIDCFLQFNMPFNTYIYETNQKFSGTLNNQEELLIPTLIIKNKQEFDKYLIEYTEEALNFYPNTNYPEEILNNKMINEKYICPEKMILTTIWSNATVDDFQNPVNFLKRRIAFFKNSQLQKDLGYLDILKGILKINIKKDNILNETPNQMEITLNSKEETYTFPQIKFGISDNKCYIYAIQNKNQENNVYSKKINRNLYKVNNGLFDDYEEENIKDVTPSFLVALNIAISYFQKIGIEKLIVPTCLITRWNAKTIAITKKAKIKKFTSEQIALEIQKQNLIWTNINEKLIRTFRRLSFHNPNIKITAEPFLIDSALHLEINKNNIYNNDLLEQTSIIVDNSYENNHKKA